MSEPAKPPSEGGINAPNNSGIIAPNNSGTITQNQGPPRVPLGLYQDGQSVGRVAAFSINSEETQITFSNPRLAGGMIDKGGNLEFQDYIISCPQLMASANPNAAMNSIVIVGDIVCQIISKRR